MKIKIVYLADYPHLRYRLAEWFMKEWGERYPERTLMDWANTQTYLNKTKLPVTLVALANHSNNPNDSNDKKIVGTVCLRENGMDTHTQWTAWLSYLVIPEEHRGKGIAKLLLDHAVKVAEMLGLSKLHLFTRLSDQTLYLNKGWEIVGQEMYRGGIATIMEKQVKLKDN